MPPEQDAQPEQGGGRTGGLPSWLIPVLLAVVALVMISALFSQDRSASEENYSDFVSQVEQGNVESVTWNTADGTITGTLEDGQEFRTVGPLEANETIQAAMQDNDVEVIYDPGTPNFFTSMIPLLLPFLLIIGFFVWMNRRAQGQMGGIMSIGRSKAKTYTTERPATLFADVAGYEGVKRGRRLPQGARPVPGDRRQDPQGRSSGRPSGNRQDAHRPCGGR
jgi:cell division protease FtsH